MKIQEAIQGVFMQLGESLQQLDDEQYVRKSPELFNATIGQHVRHIIELFICLDEGYHTGVVNYEKRKRDYTIENDRNVAMRLLREIPEKFYPVNRTLMLESTYDEHSDEIFTIPTNYFRELVYNLEHTVHHMALIRIGINDVSAIRVPEGFGVASSTLKYKRTQQAA